MADQISGSNGNHGVVLEMKDSSNTKEEIKSPFFSLPFIQKLIAEFIGTYFLVFAGCGSMAVNLNHDKVVTLPGIAMAWGLAVMVLVYSVGHISGAHFNPAVTIAFTIGKRFPWKQAPAYVLAQIVGATSAGATLRLLYTGELNHFLGTRPSGSDGQAFVVEFIISFYLMFVVSGVATDNRAIGELAGLAIGGYISIAVLIAGPITGASMNPARSLGSAIASYHYDKLWIYIVAPTAGAIFGALVYNLIRFTNKPLREIVKSGSFLRSSARSCSS